MTTVCTDIFDDKFTLDDYSSEVDIGFFSFLLSHFNDSTIEALLQKIKNIKTILIVDSYWTSAHKIKYKSNQLSNVRRKIDADKYIYIPKRFFKESEIESLLSTINFKPTKFIIGNYWFACFAARE